MKTIIKNGMVVDGTGRPAYKADVLVDGDRIADVIPRQPCNDGRATFDGRTAFDQEIDASLCLVTPGFIDSHSHSDAYLLIEPDAPSKLSQGITTEINGQCGGSAAPRYGAARLSSDWASMTYPGGNGPGPTWRSLADYRARFAEAKPSINTIQFIGHNTLRSSVIGYEALRATPETLREMENLLARELDDGGWGLTTGLIYQPGKYSDSAEVEAIARVAAAKGGYYATHMRSESDRILEAIDEVLALVDATGIRAEVSHLKTSGRANWPKIGPVLDKIQTAVDSGRLLGSDRYPYCAAGTDLDVVFPDWAGVGGCPAECERLADPATFARIAEEIDASGRDWTSVMIGGTWCEETKCFSGLTVAEILERRSTFAARRSDAGCRMSFSSPGQLVCSILREDACRTGAFFFCMSEENLQLICERPWIVPGSDASLRAPWGQLGADHPHPRAYGTMPRFFRLLTGRIAGHAKIASREEAVARMTSIPARRFGIRSRGVIEKGAFADVAVWREDEFRDTATYEVSHSFSSGMEAVFVNGVLSYRSGEFLHAGAGRFLTRED